MTRKYDGSEGTPRAAQGGPLRPLSALNKRRTLLRQFQQLHDAGSPMAGRVIDGRYHLTRKIGEGAFGEVYQALHLSLNTNWAIKILSENVRDDTKGREMEKRFVQEARTVASIKHENVVLVTDFGKTEEGKLYLVMEFLEGRDLGSVILSDGSVGLERAKSIMSQICKGLGAAHGMGIIHRDMKPDNVLLTKYSDKTDFVKLIDFGIAKMADERMALFGKLTQDGIAVGTPEYMSPEQAKGKGVDHRSDIYAAGIMFYEMLCGRPPFEGENFMEILHKHLYEEPKLPSVARPDLKFPPEVDQVILRVLEKDKEKRFQSIGELEAAIMSIPDSKSKEGKAPAQKTQASLDARSNKAHAPTELAVPAETDSIPEKRDTEEIGVPVEKPKSSRRAIIAALIGAGAAIIGGTVVSQISMVSKPQKPPAASVLADASLPDATKVPGHDAQADSRESQKRKFSIKITSKPTGASVLRGNAAIGTTPFSIELPEGMEKEEFTLRKQGYKDEAFELVPDGNKEIEKQLEREAKPRPIKKIKKEQKGLPLPDYLKKK